MSRAGRRQFFRHQGIIKVYNGKYVIYNRTFNSLTQLKKLIGVYIGNGFEVSIMYNEKQVNLLIDNEQG